MQKKYLFPKADLGFFPTPLTEMRKLSDKLGGPRIYIKRDDLTGLAMGGNKVRKLEYLIGDALAKGCDSLITGGAEQSNHCRQTAAAAAAMGLKCHLVLGGEEPQVMGGNLLLDKFFGAEIHWSGEFRKGETIPEISDMLSNNGSKPYLIPYGGSNEIGALGFVNAVWELNRQLREMAIDISHIVFASSSGGTHAGLIVGNAMLDLNFELVGIGIDKEELPDGPFEQHVLDLAISTADRLFISHENIDSKVIVRKEYLGYGYGIVGSAERNALKIVAQTEGILLDPVYTGRAMAGLIDLIEKKKFSNKDNILFWHTGGTPALFPYWEDLL